MSSDAKPRASTGSTTTRAKPGSGTPRNNNADGAGGDMIVTRGLQEILERERRNSGSAAPSGGSATRRKKGSSGPSTGPNFVVCYLCGRQFGTASISIHRPQCYLKKMIEWERGDPNLRGPKPVDPGTHEKQIKERMAAGGGRAPVGGKGCQRMTEHEAYNAAQFEAFTTQALAPCPNCGRTFLPDRLQVHLRSCRPGSTARPVLKPDARATLTIAGGGGAAAPASTADQPIRASGAYHYDAAAGAGDAPPGATVTAGGVRSPNLSQSRATSGPREDRAVSYRPSAKRVSAPRVTGSVRSMGDMRDSDVESQELQMEEVGEEAAPISPSAHAEVLGEEEVAITATTTASIYASGAGSHATSKSDGRVRRVSIAGEPDGMSTPRRYASMEPGTGNDVEPQPSETRAHAEDVEAEPLFTTRDAAAAMGAAAVASIEREGKEVRGGAIVATCSPKMATEGSTNGTSKTRPSGLPSVAERRRMRESNAAREAEGNGSSVAILLEAKPGAEDPSQPRGRGTGNPKGRAESGDRPAPAAMEVGEDDEGDESTVKRTIPLNNVSHFKNVQSRLKIERERQQVSLAPCKYCGRTFNPLRVEKHESVCTERNKAPAPAVNRSRRSSGGAPNAASSTRRVSTSGSSTDAAPAKASSPSASSASRFCTECGAPYGSAMQKFCGSCGAKCAA